MQIQESVVMPNMDDIAFFESSQFNHRGGIWDDASRHERSTPSGVPDTPVTEDAPSVLQSDSAATLPTATTTDPEVSTAPRSHSDDELAKDTGTPLEGVPMTRAVTQEQKASEVAALGLSKSPSTGSTRNRRRTWFSSVGSADLGGVEGCR